MKKIIRKLFVFLIAVIFLCKSLYGDIQYARADEYTGSEVTVTEEESGEEIDVSGGDVSGDDVSGDDVSGGDVSGDDVSGGDVIVEDEPIPGADTPEEPIDEPEPVIEPIVNKNTDLTVFFFVLKPGYLNSIEPEKNGTDVTSNGQKRYDAVYVFADPENYGLDFIIDNYSYENVENVYDYMNKGMIRHLSLPDEFGIYESLSEQFGVNKQYGEDGREYFIEELLGHEEYVASLVAFFKEQADDGSDTKNVVYATGDTIDWYVLKHSDTNAWHVDGFMSEAKAVIAEENKPVPISSVYTYDGTSKISEEESLVLRVIDAADDSLPGSYVVESIVYKDAFGNVVSEMTNVGNYSAVATLKYVYQRDDGELSYESDLFDLVFPVVINKRTVTVVPTNAGKNEGQPDPEFKGTVSGAVSSDPVTAYFWRIMGNEAPGKYPIYSTVIASGNYNVVAYDGEFTIYAVTSGGPGEEQPGTPGPTEEIPGVVTPEEPEPTESPAPVVADDTAEIEDEEVPMAAGVASLDDEADAELDEDSLEVGDIYPALRDLTIEDDETPLAAFEDCWIHWLIVLLTASDVLYTVIQAFRNGAVIKKLKEGKE